ncbi:MAG TPA: SHOCT domain-containing protein [Gaiella sp.]|nr:SHOCT domain-containing protein [Gaiella sp.]
MFGRRGPGLVGMAARTAVVAGTATAVSGRVHRRQQQKYAGQDAQYVEQQAVAMEQGFQQGAEMAAAEPDYTAELQQLAQLKTQGILTEEEFEAKKRQILGI